MRQQIVGLAAENMGRMARGAAERCCRRMIVVGVASTRFASAVVEAEVGGRVGTGVEAVGRRCRVGKFGKTLWCA